MIYCRECEYWGEVEREDVTGHFCPFRCCGHGAVGWPADGEPTMLLLPEYGIDVIYTACSFGCRLGVRGEPWWAKGTNPADPQA